MSYKVKPEDVPDELIDDIEASVGDLSYMWDSIDPKSIISATINAAIDAGLVSPPVYVVRNLKTGKLEEFAGDIMLTLDPEPEPMATLYRKETWKGEE